MKSLRSFLIAIVLLAFCLTSLLACDAEKINLPSGDEAGNAEIAVSDTLSDEAVTTAEESKKKTIAEINAELKEKQK